MKKIYVVAAILGSISSAYAYLPPSYYVVRMIARKHANIDEGRFRSKVTFYRKNGEVLQSVIETLNLTDPEHATVRLTDSAGAELITRTRKLVGGKSGDLDRPVTYDLTLIRDSGSIYEHFKALGLPLKTEAALYSEKEGSLPYKMETYVNLERYERTNNVVVGEKPRKVDTASLWVEKDSFLPMRAFFPSAPESGMASEPLEFRLSSYHPHKNYLYPNTIAVFRNGTLFAKIDMQDVKSGVRGPLDEPQGKAVLDGDLKDAVETYFKWVR